MIVHHLDTCSLNIQKSVTAWALEFLSVLAVRLHLTSTIKHTLLKPLSFRMVLKGGSTVESNPISEKPFVEAILKACDGISKEVHHLFIQTKDEFRRRYFEGGSSISKKFSSIHSYWTPHETNSKGNSFISNPLFQKSSRKNGKSHGQKKGRASFPPSIASSASFSSSDSMQNRSSILKNKLSRNEAVAVSSLLQSTASEMDQEDVALMLTFVEQTIKNSAPEDIPGKTSVTEDVTYSHSPLATNVNVCSDKMIKESSSIREISLANDEENAYTAASSSLSPPKQWMLTREKERREQECELKKFLHEFYTLSLDSESMEEETKNQSNRETEGITNSTHRKHNFTDFEIAFDEDTLKTRETAANVDLKKESHSETIAHIPSDAVPLSKDLSSSSLSISNTKRLKGERRDGTVETLVQIPFDSEMKEGTRLPKEDSKGNPSSIHKSEEGSKEHNIEEREEMKVFSKFEKALQRAQARTQATLDVLESHLDNKTLKVRMKTVSQLTEALAAHKERNKKNRKKAVRIAAAAVGGGALIALTAGWAAPAVAAGLTTLGVGSAGFTAFVGSASGIALVASLFGASGAGLAGWKYSRRLADIETFEFQRLNGDKPKSLRLFVCISGCLRNIDDITLPWLRALPGTSGDLYALRWEPELLQRLLGRFGVDFSTNLALQAGQIGLKYTIASVLSAAVSFPLSAIRMAANLDSDWMKLKERAKQAGEILADAISDKAVGKRPVTLIGFSLGARVVFYCLHALYQHKKLNLVKDAILIGLPATTRKKPWQQCRDVVSGRLINVAALSPILNVPGIENYDVTGIVKSHMDYPEKLESIMAFIELES
ncbi:hypothetical protein IE077_001179 [Cardiosporidium cionae]|uniref:Transmembrane and coiled-coil domain-containing protein 4 n=1 Tax=Cardiosporidium cionae TaxID=476202 RepID=A0ABQ7JDK9_9APIC|nr:hypothetical protein IE077_001179 [Cardiosporidium cionae]|eukprot:KAF8822049.1 hypothetical protein IE077_001179 [Cardiosporidium cionae]